MAYSKTTWNNLAAPAINAENLNKIEQGIADAHDLYDDLRQGGTSAQRPSDPEPHQQYFDTELGKPIWWNGSSWVDAMGNNVN